MTKKNVEKISKPHTYFDVSEITNKDKRALLRILIEKGFTQATFYIRFFHKGFDAWEIIGIKECKRQFLNLPDVAKALTEYVDTEDPKALPGDKGYLYVLAMSDDPDVFYSCLKKAGRGLRSRFCEFMAERGMGTGTVVSRFSSENWREWEYTGIRQILTDYISSV